MKTTFDKLAIGQRFNLGVNGRYTKTGATTADKHSGSGLPVNIAFGHELVVTVPDAATQAAQINALRELVRAEQARTQALLDLQAQLPPNMSQTAFEFVRGYTRILATSKDWREVGLYELAEVFDRIEKA